MQLRGPRSVCLQAIMHVIRIIAPLDKGRGVAVLIAVALPVIF